MAADKEIRLNVNDSPLNKLRQKAESMARDMIRASREFATSGQEVTADLEEQIELMERRNRINEQHARSQIQLARREGLISPQVAQQQLQNVAANTQENKIIIDLIREVIDSIKQTSKDEIRADRADVERRIRASRTAGQFGPAGDPLEHLEETLQRQYLGLEPNESQTQNQQEARKNRVARLRRMTEYTLNKVASAENEYVMFTSMMEGIPGIGPAAATVGARGITHAENFQQSAINYARFNRHTQAGRSPIEYGRQIGRAVGLTGQLLGYTPSEGLKAVVDYESALSRDLRGVNVTNLIGAERSLGLDRNIITQLLGIQRYDKSVQNPTQLLAQFDKFIRETGSHLAVLPEIAGTFANAANQILVTRGEVNTQSLSRVITNMARQTGFRGQRLENFVGAIGNLGKSNNPVTRALMMRAFRETNPMASFVDIQEMMESPLSEMSRPGMQRFFEVMRERVGSGDALVLALQTAMPELSIKDIRDVIKTGGFSKALQRQQIAQGREFTEEGQFYVTPIERSSKKIASILELSGDALVDVLDQLVSRIFELLDKLEMNDNSTAVSKVNSIEKTESEKLMDKNSQSLMHNPIY